MLLHILSYILLFFYSYCFIFYLLLAFTCFSKSLLLLFILLFLSYQYLCIFSCFCVTYNCTVHGADLTYILLLVIFHIIMNVTNKRDLDLESWSTLLRLRSLTRSSHAVLGWFLTVLRIIETPRGEILHGAPVRGRLTDIWCLFFHLWIIKLLSPSQLLGDGLVAHSILV